MGKKKILVTGATGYVGGRLVPLLLESGYHVRAMARSTDKLRSRPWAGHSNLELVQADILRLETLIQATNDCDVVYYLVHSMNPSAKDFATTDRIGARNMVEAAKVSGLSRIIYLGGLGEEDHGPLSKHLQSRREVADILSSGTVPVTVLRAAMILGSGSASFEILRYLVERLPVMITPKWVDTPNQPISIRNVLEYLKGCLENDETTGRTFDIGGPDVLPYRRLLEIYAQEARLRRRFIIPVPLMTPKLSAYWIHIITPVPASIAVPLTEGLRNPAICRSNDIRKLIPLHLSSCREAIRLALKRTQNHQVDTCWSDAGCLTPPEWAYCGDADYTGGTIHRCGYRAYLKATPEEVWEPVHRIGGNTGYYFADLLWNIRGVLDRLAGGNGLKRGRRHPDELNVGDALDFWRVLEIEKPHRLVLLSEMITPGEAILEIEINRLDNGLCELKMLSRFLPRGLAGILYWYVLYPFHEWVFYGMLKAMAARAGKSVVRGPERFTPKIPDACRLP